MDILNPLITILEYELRCSIRYRRYLSLVMMDLSVDSVKREEDMRLNIVSQIRECDQFFAEDGMVAILMSETDPCCALNVVDRLSNSMNGNGEPRFAIVSYPSDGYQAENLLKIAHRRLDRARLLERGAVVSSNNEGM